MPLWCSTRRSSSRAPRWKPFNVHSPRSSKSTRHVGSASTSPARGHRTTSCRTTPRVSMPSENEPLADDELADRQLVLGDLLNHVLDKGVVISGQVMISIADIDLLSVDLKLVLSSVQTALERGATVRDGNLSLLRSPSSDG